MSNGVAFVLDERGDFRTRVNEELVGLEQVTEADDIELLEALIARHHELTHSKRARQVLDDWRLFLPKFWKVAPKLALSEEGPMTVVRRHLDSLKGLAPASSASARALESMWSLQSVAITRAPAG